MNIFFINAGRRCELILEFKKVLPTITSGLIWGSDPNPLAPALQVVDRVHTFDYDFKNPLFVNELIDFFIRNDIGLVIPTIDPDLERLNNWRETIKERSPKTKLLLSPEYVIKSTNDKRISKEKFSKAGLLVPKYVNQKADITYPIFIKPAKGSASIGAQVINNQAELQQRLDETEDPMVEELIYGDEYTVDVLMDNNSNVIQSIPRKRLRVRGGEVVQSIICRSSILEKKAALAAKHLSCIGPVTMQFRWDGKTEPVAMELNARMGGGLPLSIAAGGNWPLNILAMFINDVDAKISRITNNLIMTRTDYSFFIEQKINKHKPNLNIKEIPKVVIFDLDDTLYMEKDYVFSGYRAVSKVVFEEFGCDIYQDLCKEFNKGIRGDLFSLVLSKKGLNVPENYVFPRLVNIYRNHSPNIEPNIGVVNVLENLKASGRQLALISDGLYYVQKLKFSALGISEYFDYVIFTDTLGKQCWKPSCIPFIKVAKKFSVFPEQCMYIADNLDKDFIAPKALGMSTIRVNNYDSVCATPYNIDADFEADMCIDNIAELNDEI